MFDFVGAWKSTMDAMTKVIGLVYGEQTLDESSLRKRADKAEAERAAAARRLQEANASGNDKAKAEALTALNSWTAECKRLSDEAASKRD